MMENGISRALFEQWCGDEFNTVIITGYHVEGTLAHTLTNQPDMVKSKDGKRDLPVKCGIEVVSYSAHSGYNETLKFIKHLQTSQVVLVHGNPIGMN